MDKRSDHFINLRHNGKKSYNSVRIMIVQETPKDLEMYSQIFQYIFPDSVVMKYGFINEAIKDLDCYFHIDFFLLNAYCNHTSCSSLIRKIRSQRHFDMSMIIITLDPYVASAVSKQSIIHQWKSYSMLTIIQKPLSIDIVAVGITRLIPKQHKHYKKIEITNKEMKRLYQGKKAQPAGEEKVKINQTKFPPINNRYGLKK